MEPFEAAPPRGFRLNRKVYVKTVRHLDDMPMYLPTNRDGVAFVYHCNEGETAESAMDRLCDRLGGAPYLSSFFFSCSCTCVFLLFSR